MVLVIPFLIFFHHFRPSDDFLAPTDESYQHLHPNHPGLSQTTTNFQVSDVSSQLGEIILADLDEKQRERLEFFSKQKEELGDLKGTFFSKVKLSSVIFTIFEFPAKNMIPKYEKIACFEVPQIQNDGILTISNVQNLRFSHI